MDIKVLFERLGLSPEALQAGNLPVRSPIDGRELGRVASDSPQAIQEKIGRASVAFLEWRNVPAPKRGELIRLFSQQLREAKEPLGQLVTWETGKILQEGMGEVQEMIDICDFAVGLSRQLYGLTIASERPGHKMTETWHPLGVVGVISAFNFPVAVWSWNFALALVCGNSVLWKPSEKTPLTALACQQIFARAVDSFGGAPSALSQVMLGGREAGEALADDPGVALLSATGSTRMGRQVAPRVAARFGRCLLELGGNNALIVAPSADLKLTERAVLFSAVGTAGQRCTTLRRVIAHESIYDSLLQRMLDLYHKIPIGNPLEQGTLMGPLLDQRAFQTMEEALKELAGPGGIVHGGGRVLQDEFPEAYYVRPAIVEMAEQTAKVREETFAPLLYFLKYRDFEEAIRLHNDVPQGLSSGIFTTDLREAERFLSAEGSDCGIANVNIGPSGAEIGGAFGGEKETGGGRESGSDAWRNYMRRATNTINFSHGLPLAQGISFGE